MGKTDVIKTVSKYDSSVIPYKRIYRINRCNVYAALEMTNEAQHLSSHIRDDSALKYINDNFKNFHLKNRNYLSTFSFCNFFIDMLEALTKIRNRDYGIRSMQNFLTESFMSLSHMLYSYYKENRKTIEYDCNLRFRPLLEKYSIEPNAFDTNYYSMNFKDVTSCFLNLLATFILSNDTKYEDKMCPYTVDILVFHDLREDENALTEMQASKLINMYNIIYKKVYMDMCIRGV